MTLFDQAIYGAVRNGHGLKCASGNRKLASELAYRLDLPDTAPPGAEWSPFVSGFAIRDHYVVAKTFSDLTATRAGMVITHALICRLDEIVGLDDLRPIFSRLVAPADRAPEEVGRLEIEPGSMALAPTSDLASAAQLLVTPGSGPVVRIGVAGFEQLVATLWSQLWPAIRGGFSFRLSFGPNDVVETPGPTLVCTPATLIGRWQRHRIIGQTDAGAPGAAAMIDGSDGGAGLRRFAERIGAEIDDFEVLRLLEQAHVFATAKPDALDRLVPAVRLIQRLSPDPGSGEDEKRAIVDRIVAILPGARPAEMLTLRNLSLPGFATGKRIWTEVGRWFERTSYPAAADADLIQAVRDAIIVEEAQPSWRTAAKHGLENSSRKAEGALQPAFWRWSALDPRIAPALIALFHEDRDAVARFIEAAPRELSPAAATPILATAAKLKLYGLHAVTASASMKPIAAAQAQSAIEPGDDLSTMRLALRRATPGELLDAVEEVDDARVLRLAADATARTPALLSRRDMSTDANRRIWRNAVKVNHDAWRGPADPRAAFDQLLEEQMEGCRLPVDILGALSATPLADVTAFARRRELWPHIDGAVRERLLTATADSWFANPDAEIEPELAGRILADRRLDPLLSQLARGQLSTGLRLVSALTGNDNARFRRWVGDVVRATRPISEGEADLLGRSVAGRERSDTVGDLTSLYSNGRRDLAPALRHCTGLMSFWDRLWLGISPVGDGANDLPMLQAASLGVAYRAKPEGRRWSGRPDRAH